MKQQIEMVKEFRKRMKLTGNPEERDAKMLLMMEELGELSRGIYDYDHEGVLDALMDLLYHIYGFIIIANWEEIAEEAFKRVHESNMTKSTGTVRGKTKNFVPPYLRDLIK